MISRRVDHIKVHYIDKNLVKKRWTDKDVIYLNYVSVLVTGSDRGEDRIYRDLRIREYNAYRNALYRIIYEGSITKSKDIIKNGC